MQEKFGISVNKQLITVNGRQLRCPSVEYNGNQLAKISDGSWNMANVKVVAPGRRIRNWTWISLRDKRSKDMGEIKEAIKDFSKFLANNMGISIEPVPQDPDGIAIDVSEDNDSRDGKDQKARVQEAINATLKNMRIAHRIPELAFVILPRKETDLYSVVKTLADTEYGFHTICMVESNITKKNPGNYANVGMKVNLKFGGVNHRLGNDASGLLKLGKVMVVGWDVIHPTNLAGDAANLPSQVGLVASVDRYMAQWPAVAWNQSSRVEMLDHQLKDNFKSRIQLWQKYNNGQLPECILIFRDGVSEGQFKQVLDIELPRVRQACEEIYGAGGQPRITIIVSVKRHQTRFYPTSPSNTTRSNNVVPGTVVDRGVTLARYWDFFLTAHNALKGTARPARYTVLLDEIFRAAKGSQAANELEKLTHDICYLYGRATKAVSICPPAYYADIVCTRARVYAHELFDASAAGSMVSGQTGGSNNAALSRRVHPNIKDDMYYI